MSIKNHKKHSQLGHQFVIIISGIILLSLLSNAFFQYFKEKQRSLDDLMKRGESIGKLLTRISIEPLLVYDSYTISELSRNTSGLKEIVYTLYFDKKNNALTHYFDSENTTIQDAITVTLNEEPTLLFEILLKNTDIIHMSFPIIFEGKALAYIKIGLDKAPLKKLPLENLIIQILFSIFFGLIIGITIYLNFLKKVTHPIELLNLCANDIINFRFDKDVSIQGNNELSKLANTFNLMRLTLKESVLIKENTLNEMEKLNTSLEDRVLSRTDELEKLNIQVTHQATHDPLTGMPNRILIVERLNQAIKNAQRHNTHLAVFVLDLNNFKIINDTLGHPEGDLILIEIAKRIPKSLRNNDTAGRFGGDEFACILPDLDEQGALKVGQKIINALKPSFDLASQTVEMSASIGIAIYPDHGEDQAALIRHADIAMYESKKHGTDISIYNAANDTHTPWRLALMADLRKAIETNEIQLHYQPQVNLNTNKIYGVEALLRWTHPEKGVISPDQFIHIAEKSGLINTLSDWVINNAFKQLQRWEQAGFELDISINISSRNLQHKDFSNNIFKLINRYNINPQHIKFEFTEGTIMSNPDRVLRLTNHSMLKDIRYSIDDFGTGYSSLSYLQKLTVNEVKIDKSFVKNMDKNDNDACIVRSVIELTHNLGHTVVAEGVETIEVMQALKKLGCDSVQGYFISKAISADEIPHFVKSYNQQKRMAL